MDKSILAAYQERIRSELLTNILPFWMERALDHENGGYYGAITNDLVVDNDVPRSAVVAARILWTFSAAYRAYDDPAYLRAARHAYAYLTGPLWDGEYGGVYWTVDRQGRAVNDRKHVYAQAFAIYALSEYYQACGEPQALALAQKLFHRVETHSFDPLHGGNIECLSRRLGAAGRYAPERQRTPGAQIDEYPAAPDGSLHQPAAHLARPGAESQTGRAGARLPRAYHRPAERPLPPVFR